MSHYSLSSQSNIIHSYSHFHLCGSHAGEHNMKILEHACKSALLAKRATPVCITIVYMNYFSELGLLNTHWSTVFAH